MRPAAALLAALLLAACATRAPASPSPTGQPSVRPGLEQIAESYLALVDASNAATCTFNAALAQSAPALADLKLASDAYADSLGTLITGLRTLDWPTDLEADASALIHALGTNHDHAVAMAEAETLSAFIEADDQLIEANQASAAAATRLRADLGLGSAGNPCAT
jgi:hypothetical protein